MFPLIFMAIVNMSVAALLVNSNKALLLKVAIPGHSAGLSACHYFITFVFLSVVHAPEEKPRLREGLTWKVFAISLIGSFGVVCSNVTLQLSSVSFHQLSRLFSLPGGILMDIFLYSRYRTPTELAAVTIIAYTVYQSTSGDPTASWKSYFFSILSVVAMLCSASAIKMTCSMHNISSLYFSYVACIWGLLSSGVWVLVWILASGGVSSFPAGNSVTSEVLGLFVINVCCATVVNVTSTWLAGTCSSLFYALLGQCKTILTIILSTFFFGLEISFRRLIFMLTSLLAFMCFIHAEYLVHSQRYASKDLFLNHIVLLCSVFAALSAYFIEGPSQWTWAGTQRFFQGSYTIPVQVGSVTSALFPSDWITTSEALAALRDVVSSRKESSFHEATHVLYDLRSFLGDRPAKYLEIGSFTGVSASLMLTHPFPTSVTAVDPCVLPPSRFNGVLSQEHTIKARLAEHAPFDCGLKSPWKLIVGFSPRALPKDETFDIIFIDGDHSTQGVWNDYLNTMRLLRPGGFMVFDDYLDYKFSGEVRGAVDEISQNTTLTSIGVLANYHKIHPETNLTGINEYIFQANGKFGLAPLRVSHEIAPTLCVTVATYRRADGSTPGNLARLWKVLESQTYARWRLYLTGDHYDDENEWNSFPFQNDSRVYKYNLPRSGERGEMSGAQLWKNAGVAAHNDAIARLLRDGFEWAVHLDDDDHWDADHLQNILAGIRTGASFVMTSCQHMKRVLPDAGLTSLTNISHTIFPHPCRIVHSAIAFNAKLLQGRYEVTTMPADANFLARIVYEDAFYPAFVPVISAHHPDEQNKRGNKLVVRKCLLERTEAPAGWFTSTDVEEYTALAVESFPENLSPHCMHIVGPVQGRPGFRALGSEEIPYFIRIVNIFENMTVWGRDTGAT